ncbi:uncharacterized protein N0V89_001161 [Didymosphaeria variabile]|uniref:Inner centromere protein ARK-binding domain-containing protein n=1 Tax=Didymosphaeria variabile TaxID=1932322 RepID=A0A9W8XXJ7_9PLEO|nr:uncharacterized protein N0V89_001161 [Didymosphaeria variabile]KAJ4360595.1 hypothetical protein N0V89_001161 [Didymosphaeria variabile]
MAAARSKVPAIGSAHWVLDERKQADDLVSQEVEDFGFSVRNELEWLNEHMAEIFAQNGQNKLDVFKTPGKLRGKTPRTARKKAVEPRQPLGNILGGNAQRRASLAEQSLKGNLNTSPVRSHFNIVEDAENVIPTRSPVKSPVPSLFTSLINREKENSGSYGYRSQHASPERRPATGHSTAPSQYSQVASTQSTVPSHEDDVFSPPQTQSTQPTQATQSFAQSTQPCEEERRDTGDSFVSAKEAFGSKNASNENLGARFSNDAMDVDEAKPDDAQSDAQGTAVHHDLSSDHDEMAVDDFSAFPEPPRTVSEGYSTSADTQATQNAAEQRARSPEPKTLMPPAEIFATSDRTEAEDAQHDDTVVHHEVEDNMDIDDDVRSPSDSSSPVKPLVRKSSLTFASLPAREPLLAKKSMGNRNSRTSHVDPNKVRSSNLGRFTGGKSLGGSQLPLPEPQHDAMDVDEERPELPREELEATKLHNKTSSQRLLERINMLKQQNEAPKRISQNILASQLSQATSFTASQMKESSQPSQSAQPAPVTQPAYPSLPPAGPEHDDDDDDDWISPIRTVAPAPSPKRPPFSKSHSEQARPSPVKTVPKPISVSNPDFPAVVESTTPAGSPTGKKYMDGPLSASKAKFYSALRAAKEKIIGSSATSAQIKLDALSESPVRPTIKDQQSSDDVFRSPKRNEKAGTSIFSHLRSPSKESLKSSKSKAAIATSSSPAKEDGRRTRSSTEREKQKEKDFREKQRVDDRLKEMRSKEQVKAAAHHQKIKATTTKTPSAMPSQQSMRQVPVTAIKTPFSVTEPSQPRPQPSRANTATSNETDSADDMPPPPPPKSFLPTTGQKLREPRKVEPKKLAKPNSKETLPKVKPQKIMVSLHNSRYGQAPPAASKHAASVPAPSSTAPIAAKSAPSTQRMGPPATKPTHAAPPRPASALSTKSGASYKAAPKPAPRVARPPVQKPVEKPVEKPKAVPAPTRADLAAARPVARMQTIQDASRIQVSVPPVNPAKPAKRPFEQDESTLQRPPKRPSTQAKMNPITPAHPNSQFAKGKIPFAEPVQSAKTPVPQYQNGEEIKLPDIMTDSEDEDSDNEFEQPSWVNTPNLRDLLTQQQLVDPEQVFGPIAPLNMEQVFPNKERHKRFRERTSSAYWANDQVTEEERRKDREAKERLFREGAWTYNPSPRPPPQPSRGL